MYHKFCSFLGPEILRLDEEFLACLRGFLVDLIDNGHFEMFLFGSFDQLQCEAWKILTDLKKTTHPQIKRIFVFERKDYIGNMEGRPSLLWCFDFDEYIFIEHNCKDVYQRQFCRDCAIVDHSNLIVVSKKLSAATKKILDYAR